MENYIVQKFLWFRQRGFVQITQKTLVSLFPFFLFAGISRVIAQSFFAQYGFINNLFGIASWLPGFELIGQPLTNFTGVIGSLAAPLATYFAAKYTAGHYGRSTGTAGITAFIFSLIVNSRELFTAPLNDGLLTRINLPLDINILVSVFWGYVIGQIFRFSKASDDQIVDSHYIYQPKTLRPIFLSLTLAVGLNLLFTLGVQYNVFTTLDRFFMSLISSKSNLLTSFSSAFFISFFAWIGNSHVYNDFTLADDSFALDNLSHALKHHSTANIPHPYTVTTLYQGFGAFAGLGASLALLLAVLWVGRSVKDKKVSLLSIFPSLFNNGASFMVGIPVLFNFIYLIPFLLAPLVNMLLAYLALAFQLMPPAVYPVPEGTPSLLYAFIGTGGSLPALAIGLLTLVVDVLLYIPFVRLNNRVRAGLEKEDQAHETH